MRCLLLFLAFACLVRADLASVKSETNLEKRSQLAIDNADRSLDEARRLYQAGDHDASFTALAEVADSVDLALASLQETGKHPSRLTRRYKRAELKTRDLLRKLDGFAHHATLDDREQIDAVRQRVFDVHEDFLNAVMSRKKKK